MLVEINGEKYNCRLVRRELDAKGHPCISDNRNVARCEQAKNCATCMWNINYALKHSTELELRPMTKKELASLKKRNKFFPIKAKTLLTMKPKVGVRRGRAKTVVES